MPKRILLLIQLGLWLICAVAPDSRAQARRPSQAAYQVAEQRRKLQEAFERQADQIRERLQSKAGATSATASTREPDPDEVDEALIKFAAERAAQFKIDDWKGEELYALASIYQVAEQFALAREAFRAYLKSDLKLQSLMADNARTSFIDMLIETERFDEAEKWLEGEEWARSRKPADLVARTGQYLNLALAMRDRGQYEKVATLADKGHTLANLLTRSRALFPDLREFVERNQIKLAAIAVASLERLGRKSEAHDLDKMTLDFDFDSRPELRLIYDSELAAARLIGTTAPALEISRWIDGENQTPRSLNDLRGNVVLLNFWSMWSEPFVNSSARLGQYNTKFAGKGLKIIGVTKFYGRSDIDGSLSRDQEFKSLQNYKLRLQMAFPIAIGKLDDVTNEERYGVTGVPTFILIDRSGVTRQVKRGIGEYRKLEKQIERLINEK